MSLGNILRKKRKGLGLTLDEVADATGYSKPYLSTIETGNVNNPPSDALLRELEKVLKFRSGHLRYVAHIERMPAKIRREVEAINAENRKYKELLRDIVQRRIGSAKIGKLLSSHDINLSDDKAHPLRSGLWIPIINKVSAGYPEEFNDLGYPVGIADDYVRCPDLHDPNAFAVRIVGDSMETKYTEGDIVIFSPAADVQSGDDCFVRFRQPHETTFKRVFFDKKTKIRLQPRNDDYPPQIVSKKRLNGLYRAVIRYQNL